MNKNTKVSHERRIHFSCRFMQRYTVHHFSQGHFYIISYTLLQHADDIKRLLKVTQIDSKRLNFLGVQEQPYGLGVGTPKRTQTLNYAERKCRNTKNG
ncbi:unnamed protein product [Ixodes persulcatus]